MVFAPRARRRGAVALAVTAMLAGACTYRPAPEEPAPSGGPTTAPARGGALVYHVADDAGLFDPQLSSQPTGFAMVRATHRGLMGFPASGPGAPERLDPDTPVPDLAADAPTVSPDGRTYTFRLRDGARFGPPARRPVEARDVRAGIERLFRVRSPLRSYFAVVAGTAEFDTGRSGSIAGIATPDARTVVFTLVRPANDFLWMLAHTGASAVPAGTPPAIAPAALAGAGPYTVTSHAPGRETRLTRNPEWRAETDPLRSAWVDEIRVRVGTAGSADVTGEELPVPDGSRTVPGNGGCLLLLFLSPRDRTLARRDARAAIAVSLDRAALAQAAERADPTQPAQPAAGLLPPGSVGATDRSPPSPDAARATALAGSPFRFTLGRETAGPDAAADGSVATAVERMVGAAGISVAAAGAPAPGSVYDRYTAGSLPAGIARWCPDWPGRSGRTSLAALLASGGPANYGRVADAELDRLIAGATAERDPGRIAQAWKAAEERALGLIAVVPLVWLSERVPVAPRVGGFEIHPYFVRGDPTALWLAPGEDDSGSGRVD